MKWARPLRDRLRRKLRTFVDVLALALRRAGRSGEAQDLLQELARRDPQLSLPVTAVSDGVG